MASYTPKKLNLSKDGNTYSINQGIPFGTCSTAASTKAKTVTVDFFTGLAAGVTINVKFTNGNTNTSPTLNVNSSGAKPIYKYGTTVAGNDSILWRANEIYALTYDGTGWLINNYHNVTVSNIGAVASLQGTGNFGKILAVDNTGTVAPLNVNSTTQSVIGVVALSQGTGNAGKFLSVGSDGVVIPADLPEDESYLLEVNCGNITSNSTRTITNVAIAADMVVVSYYASNHNAFATPVTVDTADGSLTLTVTVVDSESSSLILYLMKKRA